MSNNLILVTGATGKQGGAVARLLLLKGRKVKAFTRKPDSSAAQELKRLGAELAVGSLEDSDSIKRAAQDVETVFAMSTPYEAGMEAETQQGINIAEAAKSAGVQHLVYTSVGSAHKKTGIPHFDSKYKVEQHIHALGIPHTIIRPVYFMENAFAPWFLSGLQNGTVAVALPAKRKLAQIAVADIAAFAVLVIENPSRFLGKGIDLASDDLSGEEMTEILSRVTGRKLSYLEVPIEQVRAMSEDFAIMYEWFDRVGYQVDLTTLRREYPEIEWHSFETWAKLQDWSVLNKT
jgi:uncharacterized protein YbjT (DUF2867 family)